MWRIWVVVLFLLLPPLMVGCLFSQLALIRPKALIPSNNNQTNSFIFSFDLTLTSPVSAFITQCSIQKNLSTPLNFSKNHMPASYLAQLLFYHQPMITSETWAIVINVLWNEISPTHDNIWNLSYCHQCFVKWKITSGVSHNKLPIVPKQKIRRFVWLSFPILPHKYFTKLVKINVKSTTCTFYRASTALSIFSTIFWCYGLSRHIVYLHPVTKVRIHQLFFGIFSKNIEWMKRWYTEYCYPI